VSAGLEKMNVILWIIGCISGDRSGIGGIAETGELFDFFGENREGSINLGFFTYY
jgi:hypothetical protein